MEKVCQYFCIFCDFTNINIVLSFNHYKSHMYMKDNCEICDNNQVLSRVSQTNEECDHLGTELSFGEIQRKMKVIEAWINEFLVYQNKLMDKTFSELLLSKKVCMECAVCRYLVDIYKKNGGEMNQIQYINAQSIEQHCYNHLQYSNDSQEIQSLDVFIKECLSDTAINDDNTLDVVCYPSSDFTDTSSHVSTERNEHISPTSLGMITLKLNINETKLNKTNFELEEIKSDFDKKISKIKDEEIEKLNTKITEFERSFTTNLNDTELFKANLRKEFEKSLELTKTELLSYTNSEVKKINSEIHFIKFTNFAIIVALFALFLFNNYISLVDIKAFDCDSQTRDNNSIKSEFNETLIKQQMHDLKSKLVTIETNVNRIEQQIIESSTTTTTTTITIDDEIDDYYYLKIVSFISHFYYNYSTIVIIIAFMFLSKKLIDLRKEFEKSLKNTKSELNTRLDETRRELETNAENHISIYNSEINSIKNDLLFSVIAPGFICYFAAESIPNFWLKCNGEEKSRTEYANLFAAIGTQFGCGDGSTTFKLPELRGEFIRCWSDGRDGVDKNRAFGSFQWGSSIPLAAKINGGFTCSIADAYQCNWTSSGQSFDDGFECNVPSGQTRNGITFPSGNNYVEYVNTTNSGHITSWNVMKGTRPRNIALLACIKY